MWEEKSWHWCAQIYNGFLLPLSPEIIVRLKANFLKYAEQRYIGGWELRWEPEHCTDIILCPAHMAHPEKQYWLSTRVYSGLSLALITNRLAFYHLQSHSVLVIKLEIFLTIYVSKHIQNKGGSSCALSICI